MLQYSGHGRKSSYSDSETTTKQGQKGGARRGRQAGNDAAHRASLDLQGNARLIIASTQARPISVLPNLGGRPSTSNPAGAWRSPEIPAKPVAVQPQIWQMKKRAEGGETLAMAVANPTAMHSPSTSPEPHLAAQTRKGHSRSEADLAGVVLSRGGGKKLAKGRRRHRSQQRDRHESAFTRYRQCAIDIPYRNCGSDQQHAQNKFKPSRLMIEETSMRFCCHFQTCCSRSC